MELARHEFKQDKFKSLVQYICYRTSGDPRSLGSTRLNKILWLSDVAYFARTGLPLTGEIYVKRQYGPVPRHILPVIRELEAEGKMVVRQPEAPYDPRLYMVGHPPSLDEFSADEISLVDALLREICDHYTAEEISEASHETIWRLAELGEEIPYEAYLASQLGEVTEEDMSWAREALKDVA